MEFSGSFPAWVCVSARSTCLPALGLCRSLFLLGLLLDSLHSWVGLGPGVLGLGFWVPGYIPAGAFLCSAWVSWEVPVSMLFLRFWVSACLPGILYTWVPAWRFWNFRFYSCTGCHLPGVGCLPACTGWVQIFVLGLPAGFHLGMPWVWVLLGFSLTPGSFVFCLPGLEWEWVCVLHLPALCLLCLSAFLDSGVPAVFMGCPGSLCYSCLRFYKF